MKPTLASIFVFKQNKQKSVRVSSILNEDEIIRDDGEYLVKVSWLTSFQLTSVVQPFFVFFLEIS